MHSDEMYEGRRLGGARRVLGPALCVAAAWLVVYVLREWHLSVAHSESVRQVIGRRLAWGDVPEGGRDMTRKLIFVLLLILIAGCARPPRVLSRPPVKHVTLVSAALSAEDYAKLSPPQQGEHYRIPDGALPEGHAYTLKLKGRDAYAAIEEVVREGATPSVILFDGRWRRLGEVRPAGVQPGNHDWVVSARWSPDGRRLGVSFQMRGGEFLMLVGIVQPPSPELREVWRGQGEWSDMAWAGGKLVWAAGTVVMAADPEQAKAVELHRDALYGYIGDLVTSPDGRFVAFDRRFDWPAKAGVWMLDTVTGTCGEVTYEDAADYYHRPLRWEGPRRLLLWRSAQKNRIDVYRAEVTAPRKSRGGRGK